MTDAVSASSNGLYYVEFYERKVGVPLSGFHELVSASFPEWTRRHPQDELVANLGRTWRMGPHPYLLIWGCAGFGRLDEWDEIFHSTDVDDLEEPLLETMTTYAAGFYRDVGQPLPRPESGPFYLETFVPYDSARQTYLQRAERAGATMNLIIERVGRFGPEPGIAVMSLQSLSDIERVCLDVPEWVSAVGTYATVGREIL
jgi:hypothetical protein